MSDLCCPKCGLLLGGETRAGFRFAPYSTFFTWYCKDCNTRLKFSGLRRMRNYCVGFFVWYAVALAIQHFCHPDVIGGFVLFVLLCVLLFLAVPFDKVIVVG